MANPEHVEIAKKGAAAIEAWRLKNKEARMDLSRTDLMEAKLSGAPLENTVFFASNLALADLSKAKVTKANLILSNLSGANLSESDFSMSDMSHATIKVADFSNTNMSNVDLTGATISYCDGTINLKNGILNRTNLIACDMNLFENLETVEHKGPSSVDIRTLMLSYLVGKDFEAKLKPFFLKAGVPKSLLDLLPEIIAGIVYCRCFVCYGEPDKSFAEKLVQDLGKVGIQCWIYSMDATPGKKIWKEITKERREREKMIVLCSAKSLVRDGVKKEIEEQMDEEPEKMIPISLDNIWREKGFLVMRGERDLKQHLIDCTYADFSDPLKYAESFRKLLKGLKKEQK